MMKITHDYYQLLGIKKHASTDDIKRAYRKLIQKYHPDKADNKDDEHIILLNTAYETLKDTKKRAEYDVLYAIHFSPLGKLTNSPTWQQFGSQVGKFVKTADKNARTVWATVNQFTEQFKSDKTTTNEFYATVALTISPTMAYHGGQVQFNHQGKTINTLLPKGLYDGVQIKLTLPTTALWVKIHVANTDIIKVDGKNLHRTLKIYPWQVALGERLVFSHFEQELSLTLPPLYDLAYPYRFAHQGLGGVGDGKKGDLYVHFVMTLPNVATLSREQKQLFEQLKHQFSHNNI